MKLILSVPVSVHYILHRTPSFLSLLFRFVKFGRTPLLNLSACPFSGPEHVEVTSLLLDYGADIDAADKVCCVLYALYAHTFVFLVRMNVHSENNILVRTNTQRERHHDSDKRLLQC
jgi:hypothetical protein